MAYDGSLSGYPEFSDDESLNKQTASLMQKIV